MAKPTKKRDPNFGRPREIEEALQQMSPEDQKETAERLDRIKRVVKYLAHEFAGMPTEDMLTLLGNVLGNVVVFGNVNFFQQQEVKITPSDILARLGLLSDTIFRTTYRQIQEIEDTVQHGDADNPRLN